MNRLNVLGWSFYDFANSAYPTVIVTVAYSIYFKNVVVAGGGDFLWGMAISVSMVIVAASAPFLGSVADRFGIQEEVPSPLRLPLRGLHRAFVFRGTRRRTRRSPVFYSGEYRVRGELDLL